MTPELKAAIEKHERIEAAFEEKMKGVDTRRGDRIYAAVKKLAEHGWSIESHPDGDTVFVEVSDGNLVWTSWE